MRYKIKDTDTQKEYYRKKLPRKMPHNIQNGIIFEVNEQYKTVGLISQGNKTLFSTLRTQKE